AVAHAVQPRARVDARNPERAHVTLAVAPVAVGVLQRVEHRLACCFDQAMPRAPVALGTLQDLLMLLAGCDAPLHSWHCFSPPRRPANNRTAHRPPDLAVWQQSCHLACVALREHRWLAQRAIARGILL